MKHLKTNILKLTTVLIIILSACNFNKEEDRNLAYTKDSGGKETTILTGLSVNGNIKSGKISSDLARTFRQLILSPDSVGKVSSFDVIYKSHASDTITTINNKGYLFDKSILSILQKSDSGDVLILTNIKARNKNSEFYLGPMVFELTR